MTATTRNDNLPQTVKRDIQFNNNYVKFKYKIQVNKQARKTSKAARQDTTNKISRTLNVKRAHTSNLYSAALKSTYTMLTPLNTPHKP